MFAPKIWRYYSSELHAKNWAFENNTIFTTIFSPSWGSPPPAAAQVPIHKYQYLCSFAQKSIYEFPIKNQSLAQQLRQTDFSLAFFSKTVCFHFKCSECYFPPQNFKAFIGDLLPRLPWYLLSIKYWITWEFHKFLSYFKDLSKGFTSISSGVFESLIRGVSITWPPKCIHAAIYGVRGR